MKMLVHVPHIPHTMWRGNECPCHNHHSQVVIPLWHWIVGAIVIIVVLKVVIYINDKLDKR